MPSPSTGSPEQKTSTPPTSNESRPRHKRTRLTSGGGSVEACQVADECGLNRIRRTSHGANTPTVSSARHTRPHSRLPSSSPSSPTVSASLSDDIHPKDTVLIDKYESQVDDGGLNRPEQMEDENSFSSSVFSEHLTTSDFPLVINPSQDEPLKMCRASLLSPSTHRVKPDEEGEQNDTRSELTKKMHSDMEGLLIRGESAVSTPAIITTDDAASSEGEDEKDPVLLPSADDNTCISTQCNFDVVDMNLLGSVSYESVTLSLPQGTGISDLQAGCVSSSPTTCNIPKSVHQSTSFESDSISTQQRMTTRSQTIKHNFPGQSLSSDHQSNPIYLSGDNPNQTQTTVSQCPSIPTQRRSPVSTTGYFSQGSSIRSITSTDSVLPILSCTYTPDSSIPHTMTIGHCSSTSGVRTQPNDANSPRSSREHHKLQIVPQSAPHPYPLRSRLRRDFLREQLQVALQAPKSFESFPTEVLFRIAHYLSIQEVFRLLMLNHRIKAVMERYLLLVKRINFSSGLPFAFLSKHIDDACLKRILSRTPEVTHILGFYPQRVCYSSVTDYAIVNNTRVCTSKKLTYAGILSAFRICTRLRSVELMDVELMSKLVEFLPRIKFHGMFRNRPDSWDCEYAVRLPHEANLDVVPQLTVSTPPISEPTSTSDDFSRISSQPGFRYPWYIPRLLFTKLFNIAAVFSSSTSSRMDRRLNTYNFKRIQTKLNSIQSHPSPSSSLPVPTKQVVLDARRKCSNIKNLNLWFEPVGEEPIGFGSQSTIPNVVSSHLLPYPAHIERNLTIRDLRDIIRRPFVYADLPPIEAEFVQPPQNNTESPAFPGFGGLQAVNSPAPAVALAFGAVFMAPHLFNVGLPPPLVMAPGNMIDQGFILASPTFKYGINMNPFLSAEDPPPDLAEPPDAPVAAVMPALSVAPRRRAVRRYSASRISQPGLAFSRLFVSPLPNPFRWIGLPNAVSNLTKIDLVSVSISALPRMDNIKYLHLKWVTFTSVDPFFNFSANKLQAFIMNNCIGPTRGARYVRLYTALARAPMLIRLELVGVPFVEGLLSHLVDIPVIPNRSFYHLIRLVLCGNKDSIDLDVGLMLLASQDTLNHISLPIGHSRDTFFEALAYTRARFPFLEVLVLGYQDPYQARLTVSELTAQNLGTPRDSIFPVCKLSDFGMTSLFTIAPRLMSLTIRHAPYLSDIKIWWNSDRILQVVDLSVFNLPPEALVQSPLRSLTLENCPGISIESLESVIASGQPFPNLETLVLRDMFLPRFGGGASILPKMTWSENASPLFDPAAASPLRDKFGRIDWRNISQLLALSDFLTSTHFGYSITPDSIGLAPSVRDVVPIREPPAFNGPPLYPFNVFYSLRLHHYLNALLEMDGSCGPRSIGRRRILSALLSGPMRITSQNDPPVMSPASFVSQATQTCVCGLLEWQLYQYENVRSRNAFSIGRPPHPRADADRQFLPRQLGGPNAFHPYSASYLHELLYALVSDSLWARWVSRNPVYEGLIVKNYVYAAAVECPGCSSDPPSSPRDPPDISQPHPETQYVSRSRKWIARDAGVDTSTLRSHLVCDPLSFTIYQPPSGPHNHLTTIHFEKVGITHVVLCGAPHLKNLTFENCSQLQTVLFQSMDPPLLTGYDSCLPKLWPALKRIRVIRCPRFAIYNLLYSVATLYPAHEENISITYRPFGQYTQQVERALWMRAQCAHVLISHDYKKHLSEREMEENQSHFDQLFRDVINFAEMLIRRDLLSIHPQAGVSNHSRRPAGFRRSEHGEDWDVVTDIPWIHEICCSSLRNTETRKSDQAEQFYEMLSEIQSSPFEYKIQRRGIHYHVQYRDVHDNSINRDIFPDSNLSFRLHEYSEAYLTSTHPYHDSNAWGDRLNESIVSSLPEPRTRATQPDPWRPPVWQGLLLAQDKLDCFADSHANATQSCSKHTKRHAATSPEPPISAKTIHLDADAAETPPRELACSKPAVCRKRGSIPSKPQNADKKRRVSRSSQSSSSS